MTTPRTSFTDDLLLDLDRGIAVPPQPTGGRAGSRADSRAERLADDPAAVSGSWAVTPRSWSLPSVRRTGRGVEAAAGPLRLALQLRR